MSMQVPRRDNLIGYHDLPQNQFEIFWVPATARYCAVAGYYWRPKVSFLAINFRGPFETAEEAYNDATRITK